jgi:hypothetical protein
MARDAAFGHGPLLKSAIEQYSHIWLPVKDMALTAQKGFADLPTAAEFFAPGELNPCCDLLCPIPGGLANWRAFCSDLYRIFCSPRGLCLPCQNGAVWYC